MQNEIKTIENRHIASTAIFSDEALFNRMEKLAQIMASGRSTIPAHFHKSPGDCFAVIMQAAQWKMSPYAVAQKTHVIKGTMGYEAQLINAVIISMAPTTGRLKFEWFGEWNNVLGKFQSKTNSDGKPYHVPAWKGTDEVGLGVKVWATLKGEDAPRVLELLLVQAQVRNSTLWASDPKQQLAYLAIKRWSRLHTPDVIMGVYTPDELEDRQPIDMGTITPEPATESKTDQDSAVYTAKKKAKERAASRKKQSTKSQVSEARQETDQETITLESVLQDIDWAEGLDELKAIGAKAEKLSPEDQEKARKAYVKRANEIKQQAKVVDIDTGEIVD